VCKPTRSTWQNQRGQLMGTPVMAFSDIFRFPAPLCREWPGPLAGGRYSPDLMAMVKSEYASTFGPGRTGNSWPHRDQVRAATAHVWLC
jgi:hypothetical protein